MRLARLSVLVVLLLAVPLLGAGVGTTAPAKKSDPSAEIVPGEVIVRFADGVSEVEQDRVWARVGGKVLKKLGKSKLELGKVDPAVVRKVLALLEDDRRVLYAEPNYVVKADVLATDPSFGQLWGLHNTGQTVNGGAGSADADIDASEAWDLQRGSASTVVAIIDTGVDFGHPDLAGAQWVNPGEDCVGCRTDGLDNDGNGYVDDWRGWDFVNNDNNPTDDHGHGTHVAGTIGATADNGVGVAGVSKVSMVGLKFLSASGSGSTADAVLAVNYANAAGIKITNNSWGGGGYSQALYDAINEADARGAVFVAAAGNDSTNNDTTPHYPSNYELPNVISVAATTSRDALASFSNFGQSVHLAAPGQTIYSTVLNNGYDYYSGTSMATPHVAGALALAKAADPAASGVQLKAALLGTGDGISALAGKTASGARLNVNNAIRCASPQLWLDVPHANFTVAVGQPLAITALVGCGTANVTATVNGSPVTLTARGDGLWSGGYTPTAAGSLTVSATAGAQTRTVSGNAVDDYWQSNVAMAWIDATAGGTRLTMGDDTSATVALPFTFSFYKQAFTSLKISSNGYVVFGSSAATEYWNDVIPSTVAPNGFAAPLWDDLNAAATGAAVWYRTVGTSPTRKFVVSWINVPHYGGANGVTFQIVLEEGTNSLVYQYQDTNFGEPIYDHGGSATVGIENGIGTIGKQFSYNSPLLEDYTGVTAMRYSIGAQGPPPPPPPPDTTAPAAPTGLVASSGNASVSLDWANNVETDLSGYRVYRQNADGTWSRIAQVTASAHSDTGLTNGTAYTYYVTAYDGAGNESVASGTATATPVAPTLTVYRPASYVIESGSLYAGSLSSLYSNDSNRLQISRSSRAAQFYARTTISATERASLRKLTIDYDGNANITAVSMTLSVYNWRTGAWQSVDGPRAATLSDRAFTWTNSTAPLDYVSSSGEIRFRVRGERSTSESFRTRTDLIRFTVEY
jgi:subtilisin family serine protease